MCTVLGTVESAEKSGTAVEVERRLGVRLSGSGMMVKVHVEHGALMVLCLKPSFMLFCVCRPG